MAYQGSDYNRLFLNTLTKAADFKGRSRRTEVAVYLFAAPAAFSLVLLPVLFLLEFIDLAPDARASGFLRLVGWIYWLPAIALMARRLHDLGRNGWWAIGLVSGVFLVAAYGLTYPPGTPAPFENAEFSLGIVKFVLLLGFGLLVLVPGQAEANRFGPDPRLA